MAHTYNIRGKSREFLNVAAGGTYSYHSVLEG